MKREWLRTETLLYIRQTEKDATEQEVSDLADEFVERIMKAIDEDERATPE